MEKWKRIAQSLKTMEWQHHLLYWGYPLILSFILMMFYFQGQNWMQELAASSYNREFGLVENTQNVLLIFTSYMAFRLLRIRNSGWLKLAYVLIFLTALFVFLEEIDYGQHYINYINNPDADQNRINPNIHNIPNVNNQLRLFFYCLIAIFIIILPYFSSSTLPSLLMHFVPDIRLQLTILAFLVISKMAGIFNNLSHFTNMALNGNISEFEELPLYYLFLVYVYELYQREYNLFASGTQMHVRNTKIYTQIRAQE
jgi:hypothetical protein